MHLQIRDPRARELARKIAEQRRVSMTEVVIQALETEHPVEVGKHIQALLDEAGISLVPMDSKTAGLAMQAFADYGKGRGYPAQLNLADCLSYACAKAQGIPLLYKGKDFACTDLG